MAVVLTGVLALLVVPAAQAAWQYRGEVDDGFGTTFQLVVKHFDGKPTELLYVASGRLHLDCDGGGQRRSQFATEGPLPLFEGRFSLESEIASSAPGRPTHHQHAFIRGRVRRHAASGVLRVSTKVSRHHCASGQLRWHADFVPRSSA